MSAFKSSRIARRAHRRALAQYRSNRINGRAAIHLCKNLIAEMTNSEIEELLVFSKAILESRKAAEDIQKIEK